MDSSRGKATGGTSVCRAHTNNRVKRESSISSLFSCRRTQHQQTNRYNSTNSTNRQTIPTGTMRYVRPVGCWCCWWRSKGKVWSFHGAPFFFAYARAGAGRWPLLPGSLILASEPVWDSPPAGGLFFFLRGTSTPPQPEKTSPRAGSGRCIVVLHARIPAPARGHALLW